MFLGYEIDYDYRAVTHNSTNQNAGYGISITPFVPLLLSLSFMNVGFSCLLIFRDFS